MNHRITPDNITELKHNEIFVFGSNQSGRHGAGAAKTAMKWGANYGQSEGIQGKTYAIPTKNTNITRTLNAYEMTMYIKRFIHFAKMNPELIFLVTELGCGLGGLHPRQIAPLLKDAIYVQNIHLPLRFWNELKNMYHENK